MTIKKQIHSLWLKVGSYTKSERPLKPTYKMDNNQLTPEIQEAIRVVNVANETSVLMQTMCDKLGLTSKGLTIVIFAEAFSEIQRKSFEAQKMLAEKFLVIPTPEKRKRTRIPKV